ncbi:ubiquinol-cytochrome-c reductase complex assembly factor 2 isoform X1 [Dermochelys coriacea]|uniref:ubiquinol-cytochrome-c reductase complex assembly factor 2 isoform X1 n=1 Tax=Dermochelys coriacea TaxID=27794 RepID=UPI001CA84D5E|nr:ubiquinol-cytochrome-c reductase complex assembly factor 2 isoform X1 [Dermochelys coriacea]
MAATRYRRFLKLCEEWPVEETKRGRDLGAFLRQRVAQAFREGESSQIADPANCDQMYESLVRIHTNFYKNKYPRLKDTSFTGVTVEECKLILATAASLLEKNECCYAQIHSACVFTRCSCSFALLWFLSLTAASGN